MPGPPPTAGHTADVAGSQGYFAESAEFARKMLAALPGHREMLDHVKSRGMPRI